MLKRKFMEVLVQWKKEKDKECLLVKGARQVGKTFIIREFAKQNYNNIIELNFATEPKFKKVFDGSLKMDEIIKKITALDSSARFEEGKTLLFLDEIQDCGDARTALKPIAEDNRFDCIASGSMLGVAYKTTRSIPVGYERQIEMFSLDFEEFLWALGYDDVRIGHIREYYENKEKIPLAINNVYTEKLREYAIVGGMPSVVDIYVKTKNFGLVHKEQEKIVASYMSDISRYLSEPEKPKTKACYNSIPEQLAKENKKFQYSVVEKGSRASKFENSLEWLRDAGLIKFCNNVKTPFFPLPAYKDSDYFKVYMTDIGILNSLYGFDMKAQLYYNTLKGPAKGGIYENIVADILIKKEIPLYYYKPGESQQEIEFLLTANGGIVPLEVKAGNRRTPSMDEFIERFDPPYALKLITGNLGVEGKKITMPLYMAMFL
ncbi:MAG: ATP-binding protein [Methanomassiliicoccaceae archaeon]|jgi:predicted AAA+ superfamily ATPase|nr:ATP-binding protein [Methanomassiliicoccaceae archaeon]